jgi:hypothetical protein
VKNDFDIVAVGIQYESSVITGMIGSFSGRAVVFAARANRFRVKALDGSAIACLKGEMNATRRLTRCGRGIRGGDEDLIGPEKAWAFAAQRYTENAEKRPVKPLRRREVANDELNVVDETASVELGGFHDAKDRGMKPCALPSVRPTAPASALPLFCASRPAGTVSTLERPRTRMQFSR